MHPLITIDRKTRTVTLDLMNQTKAQLTEHDVKELQQTLDMALRAIQGVRQDKEAA